MKLYVYDAGWQGAIIVVASNLDEALKIMLENGWRVEGCELTEYDTKIGTAIITFGDA